MKQNEKEKIEILYNNLAEPKQKKNYKINNLNYSKEIKTLQPKERKKKRPNSVDINKDNPKVKIKTIKIDELGVFNRNQKWLKVKQENIKKAREMLVNKKEREINEYKRYQYFKHTSLDPDQVFNPENNVKEKSENLLYFFRLNQLRQKKTPSNMLSRKINLFKYSHYSSIPSTKISTKELKKYEKYIHDKLKGKKC